ncbi:hypothetical protein KDN34_02545 [Shewanella yunxiaonensis]|uniref:Lipoprotein n=1 Tax=Shewanella yunxiaonensis TaxID=2829809 RepID=A0ABX7YVP3_9GAMM|nr:hypothetical protein [Shewanella yunxiaonensis]QUN06364.1 hypothetical protein KDN34_02545 [Shewanella yunxiaonensis]
MQPIIKVLPLLLLLTACATSTPIQGPNGTQAFLISCGSAVIEKCYEEAAKVCPRGYVFLDKNGNENAVIMPVAGSFMAVRGRNKMLIECK